jgi:hypothetical protein
MVPGAEVPIGHTGAVHQPRDVLEAGVDEIRRSPKDEGRVELLVRRPEVGQREILTEGELDELTGLVGDNWAVRGSSSMPNGAANPDAQITLMNARAVALFAGDRDNWPLAGDQLFVDLDLGYGNLPPGTQLAIGTAVVEVTAKPHTGCAKFTERFGLDAIRLVNSDVGQELNLRGINARVVLGGTIRPGDVVRKRS